MKPRLTSAHLTLSFSALSQVTREIDLLYSIVSHVMRTIPCHLRLLSHRRYCPYGSLADISIPIPISIFIFISNANALHEEGSTDERYKGDS
ncbi:hypothetical protein CC80DRAFT_105808 [Byssothecium circinans]|uniref:Uncharacterized protein n=1 Tax=Byssothecium circinans TaxID=147558 RepID=A0A6A5UDY4_9PLEO|nr:hypothetical protein CC80DRAFT_105808 [Byssothecium circinans]